MTDDEARGTDVRHALARIYPTAVSRLRRALAGAALKNRTTVALRVDLSCDVDDLIQDVFARLLASRARVEEERDPIPYLLAMARNLRIDWIRRSRRQALCSAMPTPGGEAVDELVGAERSDPSWSGGESEDAIDHVLRMERLAAYIERLPPPLAAAYELRFVRGLSQREVAAALGVTRRRVRTLEQRLLSGAANELAENPESEPPFHLPLESDQPFVRKRSRPRTTELT